MQVPRQSLEVAQHLEARHAQAALAHGIDCRLRSAGMPGEIVRVQHDLREAGGSHRAQLGLERPREANGVHPEVIEIHCFRWLTTSSKVTLPRYTCVSAPFSLGCTGPRSTNTTPRSLRARVAAGTSGAPKPMRTNASSQCMSSEPGGGSMSCR